jgi:hypothetical protein
MLRRVVLVRTDVSEERIASIIMVTRIGELGTTLAVTTAVRCEEILTDSCYPDGENATFLRNFGSHKRHTR